MSPVSKDVTGQLGVLGSGVLLGLGIRLVQSAAVARLLGVAEFGKLAAVLAFVAIVSRLNDGGLPASVSYHFRREPGSLGSLLRVIGSNFLWCVAIALLLVFVATYLPLPFARDLTASRGLQVAFVTYLAVSTPASILPGLLTAAADYGSYVRLTNLEALLQAVLVVSAILAFGTSYQPVIAALAVTQCLAVCLYLWHMKRYRHQAPEVRLPARAAYTYGLRLQWGVIMKLISGRADILIIGALLPVSQLGLYSVALTIRDLGLLPQSVYAAPFMNLVIDRSRNDRATDSGPVLTTLILQVGLSITMVIIAVAALPFLIPLVYGAAFVPAVAPSTFLFASLLFLGPASLCWMTFNAKGRPDLTSLLLTAGGIVGPMLTYSAIRAGYGLMGVAAAAVLTSALTLGLAVLMLQRLQRYRGHDLREGLVRAGTISRLAASQVRSYLHRLVGPQA